MLTAKEAERITGRSARWMRDRQCGWCGQSLLNAVRYGCGALSYPWPDRPAEMPVEDCKPAERRKPWWK